MEKMHILMVSGTEVGGNWQCRWSLHWQEEDIEKVGIKKERENRGSQILYWGWRKGESIATRAMEEHVDKNCL